MFKDKVVIVTGSARGIGRAIAENFAKHQCKVIIADLDKENCIQTASEISKKFNVETLGISCNVSKLIDCQELAKEAFEKFGQLDIWVNNAGVLKDNLIKKMTEEEFDLVLDVNLKGVFNGMKAASEYMLKAEAGKIVNISSISGFLGIAGQANYSSSKAGVMAMTKTAAREFASKNITVNSVAPGFILTEMTEKLPEKVQASLDKMIPLKKKGTPQDIANGVLFLASSEADFITGVILRIDGGMTIGF